MSDDLTHDSYLVLLIMYHDYLKSRKLGFPIRKSRYFDPFELHDNQFGQYTREDFYDLIRELDRHGYVNVTYGNNIPMRVNLSDKAIRFGENKFKNQINKVINGILKIKSLISPFN